MLPGVPANTFRNSTCIPPCSPRKDLVPSPPAFLFGEGRDEGLGGLAAFLLAAEIWLLLTLK
jgi:hypothetical protein